MAVAILVGKVCAPVDIRRRRPGRLEPLDGADGQAAPSMVGEALVKKPNRVIYSQVSTRQPESRMK